MGFYSKYGNGSGNSTYVSGRNLTATLTKGEKTKKGYDGKDYYKFKIRTDSGETYVCRVYDNKYTPANGKLKGVECLPVWVDCWKVNRSGGGYANR